MKAPAELEYRTLQFLENGGNGEGPGGPSPLTCFPTWPAPPLQAARRLAAEANAARGRDLVWLIGVKAGKPRGVDPKTFESWLAAVTPFFDGLAPRVTGYAVPTGPDRRGQPVQVMALQIETQRAPFVIRPARGAGPQAEVPWWDAAAGSIRSAGRLELVKLLAPLQDLPSFEVLEAELTFYRNPHAAPGAKTLYRWTLDGSMYVVPTGDARVVIPLHRCRGGIASADGRLDSEGTDLSLTADKGSPAVRVTESAALVEGLGRIFVYCCGSISQAEIAWQDVMSVRIDLLPAGAERTVTALASLTPVAVRESNQAGRWKL